MNPGRGAIRHRENRAHRLPEMFCDGGDLNPVSRFWPHPKVIRTLMHEYVPESRCKTTYSLMAAGVREVRSRERYAHQQYIVKTMASYRELLEWRNQLAQINMSQVVVPGDEQLRKKDYFFMEAFRTSYQLLFKESPEFPSVHVSDVELKRYLDERNMYFLAVKERQGAQSTRTKQPTTAAIDDDRNIRHCTAYNTIMSVLLSAETYGKAGEKIMEELDNAEISTAENNTETTTSSIANFMIAQIDVKTLADVLEEMRTDGLVTKKRGLEAKQSLSTISDSNAGRVDELLSPMDLQDQPSTSTSTETMSPQKLNMTSVVGGGEWQNQLKCTQFYRHYFQSEYHRYLCESLAQIGHIGEEELSANGFGSQENPGHLLALANHFCANKDEFTIETSMPGSIKELFVLLKSARTSDGTLSFGNDTEEQEHRNQITANATKQLRYLESTEFRLEVLEVHAKSLLASIDAIVRSLPEPDELATAADGGQTNRIPADKIPPSTTESGTAVAETSHQQKQQCAISTFGEEEQRLFDEIDRAGIGGITEEELKAHLCPITASRVENEDAAFTARLQTLLHNGDALVCGVDTRRYVSARNAAAWLVRNRRGDGFVPKPWLFPSGQINWHILRWMLEGVFLAVLSRPGLTLPELISHFQFILQPSLTQELLQMLVRLQACILCTKELTTMQKPGPFSRFSKKQTHTFIQPCTDGLEKLVMFNEFKLKPLLEETAVAK